MRNATLGNDLNSAALSSSASLLPSGLMLTSLQFLVHKMCIDWLVALIRMIRHILSLSYYIKKCNNLEINTERKIDVIDQTRKTVFDHIAKHREEILNIRSVAEYFFKNFEVFGNVVKHCLSCLINLNRN